VAVGTADVGSIQVWELSFEWMPMGCPIDGLVLVVNAPVAVAFGTECPASSFCCGGCSEIQARFLIPMAISLGFGILFETLIALVIIPCMYLALVDIKGLVGLGSRDVVVDPVPTTLSASI
jgi:hypothetical protein